MDSALDIIDKHSASFNRRAADLAKQCTLEAKSFRFRSRKNAAFEQSNCSLLGYRLNP